jgi:hypothetical protein
MEQCQNEKIPGNINMGIVEEIFFGMFHSQVGKQQWYDEGQSDQISSDVHFITKGISM